MIETYDGIVECLKTLANHVERLYPSGWEFYIPDDLVGDKLTKGIVGFKISVDDLNCKRKLGQNRPSADFSRVIEGLQTREDDNSRWVSNEMKRMFFKTQGESK